MSTSRQQEAKLVAKTSKDGLKCSLMIDTSTDEDEEEQVTIVHPDGRVSRRRGSSSVIKGTVRVFLYLHGKSE